MLWLICIGCGSALVGAIQRRARGKGKPYVHENWFSFCSHAIIGAVLPEIAAGQEKFLKT
jgi:hypothetical protein